MTCICHFIFMSCSEPLMGISGVGSFLVQSGGSLIIFQLFKCRNLALNRMLSYIRGRHGGLSALGASVCPHTSVHPQYIQTIPAQSYAPICLNTPIHLYAPYSLYICLFSYVSHMSWGLGRESVYPICTGVFWGTSVHLSGISVSVGTSICLSVHNSHASCSPSLWATSLLDWMLMEVYYASCCCSFLCSFHYVSSFYYHDCDYYSSSDCCVFWYTVSSLNSYHGPLLDGASSNMKSARCGSATTADT